MGKLVSLAQARSLRQELRRQGKTVVFTNGVFDLLHVGHVRYLRAARELGDVLFVGLNSDSSVQKLKGRGRPLIAQAERAEVLCALSSVDYVVLFDELTAERLVEALRPGLYAKGGDYADEAAATSEGPPASDSRGEVLPEVSVVERYGGRVVIMPYVRGYSTSEIVQRVLSGAERERGG